MPMVVLWSGWSGHKGSYVEPVPASCEDLEEKKTLFLDLLTRSCLRGVSTGGVYMRSTCLYLPAGLAESRVV